MLDLGEVQSEIARIENGKINSFSAIEKLALLYIVNDHNTPEEEMQMPKYSYAAAPPTAPKSDFLEAVGKVPIEKALDVLDEHMEAIKLLYPKEYKAVINKILA